MRNWIFIVKGIVCLFRIMNYLDSTTKNNNYDKEYEMPYYHWEAELSVKGNDEPADPGQGYFFEGFKGLANLSRAPNENRLSHIQIKK